MRKSAIIRTEIDPLSSCILKENFRRAARLLYEMFRTVQTLFMTDSKEKNTPGLRLQ